MKKWAHRQGARSQPGIPDQSSDATKLSHIQYIYYPVSVYIGNNIAQCVCVCVYALLLLIVYSGCGDIVVALLLLLS